MQVCDVLINADKLLKPATPLKIGVILFVLERLRFEMIGGDEEWKCHFDALFKYTEGLNIETSGRDVVIAAQLMPTSIQSDQIDRAIDASTILIVANHPFLIGRISILEKHDFLEIFKFEIDTIEKDLIYQFYKFACLVAILKKVLRKKELQYLINLICLLTEGGHVHYVLGSKPTVAARVRKEILVKILKPSTDQQLLRLLPSPGIVVIRQRPERLITKRKKAKCLDESPGVSELSSSDLRSPDFDGSFLEMFEEERSADVEY